MPTRESGAAGGIFPSCATPEPSRRRPALESAKEVATTEPHGGPVDHVSEKRHAHELLVCPTTTPAGSSHFDKL